MGEFNNQFRSKLTNIILVNLFNKANEILNEELMELRIYNGELADTIDTMNCVLLYKNKVYPNTIRIPHDIIPLHSSLEPRMLSYLNEKVEIDNEYLAVSAYIKKLLNTANTLEDIFLLFPTVLSKFLIGHLTEEREFSTKTLTNDAIAEFKEDTKLTINYVKERTFKNFLINKE